MINARSAYHIVKQSTNLTQVDLKLYIRDDGVQPLTLSGQEQYALKATPVTTDAGGSQPFVIINIAELIRDYIVTEFDGTYVSSPAWVVYEITRYISGTPTVEADVPLKAFDGYHYYEEGTQSNVSGNEYTAPDVLQSNTTIYKSDDAVVRIPVLQDNTPTITFYYKGVETNSETISVVDDNESIIRYIDNSGVTDVKFKDRVATDSGTYEPEAVGDVFMRYKTLPCDKIVVTTSTDAYYYDVKDIPECKYTPYKLVFVNKFGALQDVWFFKRSSVSLNTTSSSYKSNLLDAGTPGFGLQTKHQKKILNKTGAERMSMNSGLYPEEYNEVFRQLLLADHVWIDYNDQILPVNILTSDIEFKTSLNDKLINYTIDIEFAFDKIINIG